MDLNSVISNSDEANLARMLSSSGYSDQAIVYYLTKPSIGPISDADQVCELTGECGDTMKVYLKLEKGRIQDTKFEVLGCAGAVAAAMATADLVKGKSLEQARSLTDRDVFRLLKDIPEKKIHCIHLAVKTMNKAVAEALGE